VEDVRVELAARHGVDVRVLRRFRHENSFHCKGNPSIDEYNFIIT
jgi:hypothetical protein